MKAVRRPPAPYAREHDTEAQPGLPEPLPSGERILWQGRPEWRRLALRAFHLRKLALYFGAMLALRVAFLIADGAGAAAVTKAVAMLLPLVIVALGLVAVLAWLSARTTLYTITDKRLVMRIGIVLTLTYNIPFSRIVAADLRLDRDGIGDLPLRLAEGERIAWLHLWPHARPWRLGQPQPMLRSVTQAAEVARLLGDAWSRRTGQAATPQLPAAEAAVAPLPVQPAMAGHG